MAEKGETRDPSSHRTPTQIRRLSRGYNSRPEVIERRDNSNAARALLAKEGKVHKGDGKDVDHIKPQVRGGSNARSNLRVMSKHANRSRDDGV